MMKSYFSFSIRFQCYLPDGSVCDVRCLLSEYSGDDIQEVT